MSDATSPKPMADGANETSQRKQVVDAEAAAAEAKNTTSWLEAILAVAPAFIVAVNPKGAIEYINRVLPQYTKEQVIGSHWLNYFPPDVWPKMEAALAVVLASGTPQTYETSTMGPQGVSVWFSSQLGPIRDGDKIVGCVLVAQDITETKRTQMELLAARRMAVLGTVAAGVAHEINTPVQFVGDSIQFLRESAADLLSLIEKLQALRKVALEGGQIDELYRSAARAETDADLPYLRVNIPAALDRCAEGLDRVATIVRSLKEFAHPSEREMRAVDLNHAIQGTLTIATAEYKYVAELETSFGDIPQVVCHPSEISQAVLNIVVNAAHAIGDVVKENQKGVIRVTTRREGDTVVIAISDTGTGIAPAHRTRIFDPFFTTKEVGKGTGQGLAIAWSTIVERHGGKIDLETEAGRGTTFLLRLPIDGSGATVDGSSPTIDRSGATTAQ